MTILVMKLTCCVVTGKLMFLHTNMSPKWNLAIPPDFDYYSRRWQVTGFALVCCAS